MIWTLLVFGITMFLLSKFAFPRIREALERRQKAIEDSIDTAERTREEADKILAEYRERLKEAREQAEEIVQRARQTAETHEREAKEPRPGDRRRGRRARRARHRGGHARALDDIRREVADLTVLATEKVTRKSLDRDDQRRLVEEALGELDFSGLSSAHAEQLMEELARVYAPLAVRGRPRAGQARRAARAARAARGRARRATASCRCSSSRPTSPPRRSRRRSAGMLDGADASSLNFLALLIEKHRMPVIFRIRREFDRLWEEENRMLPVEITSAVALDEQTTEQLGRRSASAPGAASRSPRASTPTSSAASS